MKIEDFVLNNAGAALFIIAGVLFAWVFYREARIYAHYIKKALKGEEW